MKCSLLMICILLSSTMHSQYKMNRFHQIDWEVQFINAFTPDSLSYKLTSFYKTELEKVRAIYSWMTRNIAYNTRILTPSRNFMSSFNDVDFPDSVLWKSGQEMTAYQVLKRRIAVCEGYANLFSTLCKYAGIRSEVITGYARCCPGQNKFRTNHSWNAVFIDSTWHLLDVTWGSGFINHQNEFVQQRDDKYFLVPPSRFIEDHFPDDLRWTLLEDIPQLPEFRRSPFLQRSFVKYTIGAMSHSRGVVESDMGDTLAFSLEIKDRKRDERISPDPFLDSSMLYNSPRSVFLDPVYKNRKAVYQLIVRPGIDWIHLVYNGDIILRYRLKARERTSPLPVNESSK